MSTRCYDTDLNDAAWAWIAPYLPAARSGGRPRTTDLRAVLNAIFYLLRTGCQWRLLPREFPRPGTVYHYFRALKDAGVLAELQRTLHEQARLSRGRLPCPSVVILRQSVGQDHRARRHPWFRWAQTGQRAQTPPARGHPGDGGGPLAWALSAHATQAVVDHALISDTQTNWLVSLEVQTQADFTYAITGNVIAIVDLDLGHCSVTNDIENILPA
jgi:putative transposase